jgi:hypothetical protein
MSFHETEFSNGMLMPDEIKLVKSTFQRVVQEDWVPKESDVHSNIARYTLLMYNSGIRDEEKLYFLCLSATKKKFAQMGKTAMSMHE